MTSTLVHIPPSLSLSVPLLRIGLSAQPPVPAPTATNLTAKTNHWLLHPVSPSTTFQLDFSPQGRADGSATLIISERNDFDLDEIAKTAAFAVREGLQVKDLIDAITRAGLEKYLFSERGQGCRYWIGNVLKLLRDEGVITRTLEFNKGLATLEKVWEGREEVRSEEQSGVVEGRFY